MIITTKATTYYNNILSKEDEQKVRDYAKAHNIGLEEAVNKLIGYEIDFIDSWYTDVMDEEVVEVEEEE